MKKVLVIMVAVVVLLIFFLFIGSIIYPTVPSELKSCHEQYGNDVQKQIKVLENKELDKTTDCAIWKEYVIELGECISDTLARNSYPSFLLLPKLRSTDSVNTYNASCPDNPIGQ